jgi:hypothetical protein
MVNQVHGQRVYVDNLRDIFDGDNIVGYFKITDGVDTMLVNSDGSVTATLAAGSTITATLAALSTVIASINGSSYYDGTTALTPAFAFANVAASQTDSSIVTATAAKVIRVLQVAVVAGASDTSITFNSKPAGAGAAISPLFANTANGGEILPFSPIGWFETVVAEGLTVTTGAGSTTGILVAYVKR